jgi:imidazolonepropionase-like amidohydrolase
MLTAHFRISLFLFVTAIPVFASSNRTYTVLIAGNPAGHQITESAPNNEIRFQYEFNDRGRGPKQNTRMVFNAEGIPVVVETSGNDYYKGPVEEKFTLQNGKASWKNQSEEGEKASATGFYLSLNSVPEETGLLAKALLHSREKSISVFPGGEAAITSAGSATISANQEKRTVYLYSISGLDFLPVWVWLDQDQTFFASVGAWNSTILKGWEPATTELINKQQSFLDKRLGDLAVQLPRKPQGRLVFEHANVFDSETARILPDQTVIVSGNRIEAVAPASDVTVPPGSEIIDSHGKTLLPGLWDMHVHLTDADGILNIAAGITSVRDCANDIDYLTELRKKFDSGTAIGPRVSRVGFIDGKGPYAGPSKVLVDNEAEARAAVRRYVDLGYDQIKVYSSLKPELVPIVIEEAHKHGKRVSGHIPAFMTAEQAVKMGLNEIHHANFLFLNFLFDIAKDTRTPLRFTAVAEHGAELDLESPKVKSFLELLKERQVVLDPTVNVFESLFTDRRGTPAAALQTVVDRLPLQVRRQAYVGGLPVPEGMDQRYRDSFQAVLKMIQAAYDQGITIVAGTDALAGFTLHRELELYVKAGIPPSKVLRIATLGAAKVMKKDSELGSITKGKLADLLLVNGNPSEKIGDIRNAVLVVKDGVLYNPKDLYAALGVSAAH